MLYEQESLEETQKPSAQGMTGPLKIPWAGGQTQTEILTRASHAGIHFPSLLHASAGISHQLPENTHFAYDTTWLQTQGRLYKVKLELRLHLLLWKCLSVPALVIYIVAADFKREYVYVANVFLMSF